MRITIISASTTSELETLVNDALDAGAKLHGYIAVNTIQGDSTYGISPCTEYIQVVKYKK